MWFKWVIFGIFVFNAFSSVHNASKGKHILEVTPGVQSFVALCNGLLAVGVATWL